MKCNSEEWKIEPQAYPAERLRRVGNGWLTINYPLTTRPNDMNRAAFSLFRKMIRPYLTGTLTAVECMFSHLKSY